MAAHDHGDPWPAYVFSKRDLRIRPTHGRERRFRAPIAGGQAEVPVGDVVPAPVPVIGPGEDERTGAARGERGSDLPVEGTGLGVLTVPTTIEPDLRHDQGSVTGKVVESGQVRLEALLRFQVDVEACEIDERETQVLGRGIVHVGDEPAGILGLCRQVEPLDVPLDPASAMPADDWRRDLVADRVAEDGRVPSALAHADANPPFDVPGTLRVVQEGHVLLPRQAHHHPEAVPVGQVEEPAERRGVGADRVEAICRDLGELSVGNFWCVILIAGPVGSERAVRHTPDPELLAADVQELPLDSGPLKAGVGRGYGRISVTSDSHWGKKITRGWAT